MQGLSSHDDHELDEEDTGYPAVPGSYINRTSPQQLQQQQLQQLQYQQQSSCPSPGQYSFTHSITGIHTPPLVVIPPPPPLPGALSSSSPASSTPSSQPNYSTTYANTQANSQSSTRSSTQANSKPSTHASAHPSNDVIDGATGGGITHPHVIHSSDSVNHSHSHSHHRPRIRRLRPEAKANGGGGGSGGEDVADDDRASNDDDDGGCGNDSNDDDENGDGNRRGSGVGSSAGGVGLRRMSALQRLPSDDKDMTLPDNVDHDSNNHNDNSNNNDNNNNKNHNNNSNSSSRRVPELSREGRHDNSFSSSSRGQDGDWEVDGDGKSSREVTTEGGMEDSGGDVTDKSVGGVAATAAAATAAAAKGLSKLDLALVAGSKAATLALVPDAPPPPPNLPPTNSGDVNVNRIEGGVGDVNRIEGGVGGDNADRLGGVAKRRPHTEDRDSEFPTDRGSPNGNGSRSPSRHRQI